MEERAFTWFPKLTRVMRILPPENVAEFASVVAGYGTLGEEPEFSNPLLCAVFEGVREDIDNSVNARTKNKGGRPKKESPRENGGFEVSETSETPVSENGNQFPGEETPVSENGNPEKPVSESGNPSYINHTKPSHTIPSQTKGEKGARMARPSLQEVEAEIAARGYHVDAAAFMAFYDSNGWKVGRNPMKSWRSALTTWERRDNPGGKGAGDADFSRFG